MTEEMKKDLIAKGREDLVEVFEINNSGYAGILPNGNIVSRLQYPKAIAIQENPMMGIPKPKKIPSEMDVDYVCVPCGIYFLSEEQMNDAGSAYTARTSHCGICGKKEMVLHKRHYNQLNHPKYKPNDGKIS